MKKRHNKIFWDTNVLLDVFLQREPHFVHAAKLWLMVEQKKFVGVVSTLSLTTIDYIIKRNTDQKTSKKTISAVEKLFELADVTSAVARQSLKAKLHDFEDAMQYYSAINHGCDCIITRNISDYPDARSAKIPVLSPEELLLLLAEDN